MHPEEIKAAMRMKGVTPAVLADRLKISRSTMSQVIAGRSVSSRIQGEISKVIGAPVTSIWPPSTEPKLRRPNGHSARASA